MARKRIQDLSSCWAWRPVKKSRYRNDHTGCAVSALGGCLVDEGLLNSAYSSVPGKAFDGDDFPVLEVARRRDTC